MGVNDAKYDIMLFLLCSLSNRITNCTTQAHIGNSCRKSRQDNAGLAVQPATKPDDALPEAAFTILLIVLLEMAGDYLVLEGRVSGPPAR